MNNEIVGSISINPDEVIYQLSKSPFKYPSVRETDLYRGWAKVAVIPKLYSWITHNHRFPSPIEGIKYLMEICEDKYKTDAMVAKRGEKLYMDFAREMHTMGLLQRCSLLAYVEYQKAFDVDAGVDYIASIASYLITVNNFNNLIGIQASMRARWETEKWTITKQRRLNARKGLKWSGKLFYLTNKIRPISNSVKGCWLFSEEHIKDLVGEIKDEFNLHDLSDKTEDIGIQLKLE